MQRTTFSNNPTYKQRLVDMAEQHRMGGEYLQGDHRASSIGCTKRDAMRIAGTSYLPSHSDLALVVLGDRDLEFIVKLVDFIFEELGDSLYPHWTERWLEAIPVGVESGRMELVMPRFLLKLLDRMQEPGWYKADALFQSARDVLNGWIDNGDPNGRHAHDVFVIACDEVEIAHTVHDEECPRVIMSVVNTAWQDEWPERCSRMLMAVDSAGGSGVLFTDMADDLIESIKESA
jgi:hypothetical protein